MGSGPRSGPPRPTGRIGVGEPTRGARPNWSAYPSFRGAASVDNIQRDLAGHPWSGPGAGPARHPMRPSLVRLYGEADADVLRDAPGAAAGEVEEGPVGAGAAQLGPVRGADDAGAPDAAR